jgi:hypothetical protein
VAGSTVVGGGVGAAGGAVGAMVSTAYPKTFFETYPEASQWLDQQHGSNWFPCGVCHPNIDIDLPAAGYIL